MSYFEITDLSYQDHETLAAVYKQCKTFLDTGEKGSLVRDIVNSVQDHLKPHSPSVESIIEEILTEITPFLADWASDNILMTPWPEQKKQIEAIPCWSIANSEWSVYVDECFTEPVQICVNICPEDCPHMDLYLSYGESLEDARHRAAELMIDHLIKGHYPNEDKLKPGRNSDNDKFLEKLKNWRDSN